MGRQNTAACWSWRWKAVSQEKLRSAGPVVPDGLLWSHMCVDWPILKHSSLIQVHPLS